MLRRKFSNAPLPIAIECSQVDLPAVPPLSLIIERLPLIFPAGTEHRNYVVREMAARTILGMLYAGAVEGADRWVRPSQITDMTDDQAEQLDESSRLAWVKLSQSSKKPRPEKPWYAPNSREPIRDETLRTGLIPTRAVIERPGLDATSSKPRYALAQDFVALFDEKLTGEALDAAIAAWRTKHLSKTALARTKLVKKGALAAKDAVQVKLPNGMLRQLKTGQSSVLARDVIEQFAPRFMAKPAVLWLSESSNKVDAADDALARDLGITIDPAKHLPDLILVDLGDDEGGSDFLCVFVELVASDGPITEARKTAFTAVAAEAGFNPADLAFMTAFNDRDSSEFRKGVANLAWGSFAWSRSEPDHLISMQAGAERSMVGALRS